MLAICLSVVVGYMLGSFPSGLIIGRLARGVDIRSHGSGNTGTTNVIRVLGLGWGLLVFFLDAIKGILPVLIARLLLSENIEQSLHWFFNASIAGAAAMLGHVFPVFAAFKGGKAVATGAGVLLALLPLALPMPVILFFIVLVLSGYVSLSSMIAATSLPVSYFLFASFGSGAEHIMAIIICTVFPVGIIVLHFKNIRRLLNGSEHRFEKVFLFGLFRNKQRSPPDKTIPH